MAYLPLQQGTRTGRKHQQEEAPTFSPFRSHVKGGSEATLPQPSAPEWYTSCEAGLCVGTTSQSGKKAPAKCSRSPEENSGTPDAAEHDTASTILHSLANNLTFSPKHYRFFSLHYRGLNHRKQSVCSLVARHRG